MSATLSPHPARPAHAVHRHALSPLALCRQNRLIAMLPALDHERMEAMLEPVHLRRGRILFEPDAVAGHAYFPTTAMIALMQCMSDGTATGVAVVGNDGLVGLGGILGRHPVRSRAMVVCDGHAHRLRSDLLQREFARGGALQRGVLRYLQALLAQLAQAAVCNRHHSLQQQVCRWLLGMLDRLPASDLRITQETIASLLGASREGVSRAAGQLKAAGLIRYGRGRIQVPERCGLEALACECYGVVRAAFAQRVDADAQDNALATPPLDAWQWSPVPGRCGRM